MGAKEIIMAVCTLGAMVFGAGHKLAAHFAQHPESAPRMASLFGWGATLFGAVLLLDAAYIWIGRKVQNCRNGRNEKRATDQQDGE